MGGLGWSWKKGFDGYVLFSGKALEHHGRRFLGADVTNNEMMKEYRDTEH